MDASEKAVIQAASIQILCSLINRYTTEPDDLPRLVDKSIDTALLWHNKIKDRLSKDE